MFGGMGDLMKLMGQLPKMKENLAQAAERAKAKTVIGESGAGMVKVTANGGGEIISVQIDSEALKDPDTLGPLVTAAVNIAIGKGKEVMMQEAKGAMGGFDLPPGLI
jgi:nucleoid-associated protein EbfC